MMTYKRPVDFDYFYFNKRRLLLKHTSKDHFLSMNAQTLMRILECGSKFGKRLHQVFPSAISELKLKS